MKILFLTYQRGIDFPGKNEIMYTDTNEIEEVGWDKKLKEIIAFNPELVIEREYNDGKALYMSHLYDIKKALPNAIRAKWYIDTHVAKTQHLMYANFIDIHFLAISRHVSQFKSLFGTGNAFWLPLCFPNNPDTIKPNYNEIKHPISFVGRWNKRWFPERTKMISFLKREYGNNFHATTDYDNMFSIVKRSKVSVNHSIGDDLNFRVFEVLGSGTELITNTVPDLLKIKGLSDKMHLFESLDQKSVIKSLIDGILKDDPEYTHNTLKTQTWIKEHHTIKNRLQEMLHMIQERKQWEY